MIKYLKLWDFIIVLKKNCLVDLTVKSITKSVSISTRQGKKVWTENKVTIYSLKLSVYYLLLNKFYESQNKIFSMD